MNEKTNASKVTGVNSCIYKKYTTIAEDLERRIAGCAFVIKSSNSAISIPMLDIQDLIL